ncbi:hypothetical protein G5I_03546 [Acromyrmex echinatior]|uniref:Pupal cuticle protein n=1 Tax=Acromyrmex echinatior TaxID=103372 RepID=F4WD93_ACREC|nr:hypothetical protein G5I_03546 [Acromyrmex echinatior]
MNRIKILHHDLTGQAARDIRIRCDTVDDQPIRGLHIRDSPDFPRRKPRYAEPSRQLPLRQPDVPLWHIVLSCLSLSTLAMPTYAPYQPYVNGVHGGGYYHGPAAPLAHDGRVVDTPEVAHAKKAHLAAHAEEAAKTAHYGGGYGGGYYGGGDGGYDGGYKGIIAPAGGSHDYSGYHGKYHGPPAPLGHDGRVVDTPEVAHAKAAHLTAHAHELSKVAHLSYANTYPHISY